MRKNILIISLLCFAGLVMAQDEQQAQEVKGAHPYKVEENKEVAQEYAHWSITPHVGFNYFDGDFNSEMKHAVAIPNAGLSVEYSFTPVWGVGVDYMFDMYTVTGKPGFDNADTLLNGYMHKASMYLSMDLMNLFYPRAQRKICSIHGIIGAGYAWYKNNKMYYDDPAKDPTHKRGHTASYINADGVVGPDYMTAYKGALFLQGGLNVEFNINRTLALGVRATYNYFVNDYFDGRGYSGLQAVASKNNDGILDVTLNMRVKLEAVSKTHMRNISSLETYEKDEPIMVHDTLIIQRDTTIIREIIKDTQSQELAQSYYVYFDTNRENIKDDGLITIQQVADRLAEDSTLYAIVTGYCDNTGTDKLNYALGDSRAQNVLAELNEEHRIGLDRLYSTGVGKVIGGRSKAAYGPNRRAAIKLVDKETFERMKMNLEQKRAEREPGSQDEQPLELADPQETYIDQPMNEAPQTVSGYDEETVKTVPLSQSARRETVNEYAQRPHETVLVRKSVTLSKLARKYYDNTYCWVYIYMANKENLRDANDLTEGTALIIPELTVEEMKITKSGSLQLYSAARQSR